MFFSSAYDLFLEFPIGQGRVRCIAIGSSQSEDTADAFPGDDFLPCVMPLRLTTVIFSSRIFPGQSKDCNAAMASGATAIPSPLRKCDTRNGMSLYVREAG